MGHRYGPHRPEDAPDTLKVWPPKGHAAAEVPLHPAVVRQRQQINDHAHRNERKAA